MTSPLNKSPKVYLDPGQVQWLEQQETKRQLLRIRSKHLELLNAAAERSKNDKISGKHLRILLARASAYQEVLEMLEETPISNGKP